MPSTILPFIARRRRVITRAPDYSEINRVSLPPVSGRASSERTGPIRICVIATIGASIQVLFNGRLEHLARSGFDVTVVCAPSDLDEAIRARGVRLHTIGFTRAVTPRTDLLALCQLYSFFRTERFDIVEVSTPKAALLGSLAAWAARCRCVHLLHGAVYEGRPGLSGWMLRLATSVPCRLADATYAVSPSVASRVCADRVARQGQVRVLGVGSANGVDVEHFSPESRRQHRSLRDVHQIAPDAVVIGFVGRLTRDKGVDVLAAAFARVHARAPEAVLLVVGPYEPRDRPSDETVALLASHPAVRHVGLRMNVLPYMAAMDMLVLPTRREGLPTVVLEAGALGLPVVTTDATGARDAIRPGVTGLQVPMDDVDALTEALMRLVARPSLRRRMGANGRRWVVERFDRRTVWRRQVDEYRTLVAGHRCRGRA